MNNFFNFKDFDESDLIKFYEFAANSKDQTVLKDLIDFMNSYKSTYSQYRKDFYDESE